MKVAIHQPNFLPWIGYFDKINKSDTFVFLDNVQFERGKTYTTRTKVVINKEEKWLTVPVLNKAALLDIKNIKVDNSSNWKKKHLKSLQCNYSKHPFFYDIFDIIEKVYNVESDFLLDYNVNLIIQICKYLNLKTEFVRSSTIIENKDLNGWDKVLEIIKLMKSTTYISGSGEGSKRYINKPDLDELLIELEWQEYLPKEYSQFNSKSFIPYLSIVDLLFNKGQEAVKFI